MEDALGSKASRGNICLAHDASTDGGINAEWIWNITEENKKIKVLVFDDKDRSLVPPEVNNFPLLLHKRHNGRGFEPRPLLFILSIYCLCST